MSNFDTSKVGTYSIDISGAHRSYIVKLKIVDTTAPVGEVRNLCVGVGAPIPEPKDFFVSVKESALWTAEFRENYIFSAKGEYSLAVTLSDEYGNKADYDVKLTIINDTTPPTISGPEDISLYVGDTVSYKKDFSVSDNCFGAVALDVDASGVDVTKAGTYTVVYTATDAAGNKAIKNVTVWHYYAFFLKILFRTLFADFGHYIRIFAHLDGFFNLSTLSKSIEPEKWI
jgi:hypothetical protein